MIDLGVYLKRKGQTMKLRNMSAYVTYEKNITMSLQAVRF